MKDINLMIIGIGPHSKRIYIPILNGFKKKYAINLKLGVDLKEKEEDITAYLNREKIDLPMLFIDAFDVKRDIPIRIKKYLGDFVKKNNINGVVIATEPLVHKQYALWAIANGLNILMDKPITTREGVAADIKQAKGIQSDYMEILNAYNALQKKKKTIFSVNVQRRYHLGCDKVNTLIREVADKFDAPITSMQLFHSDGQWRLPSEIVTQIYHPYCQGYGGCSHSGYHGFDMVYQYYKSGHVAGKDADIAEVVSSFVRPRGFIKQFNESDYLKYFGHEYNKVKKWNDKELNNSYKNYGEIDAFALVRLLKDDENVCNISINTLHNTSSRRTWLLPGQDLYKGNGRIKHESHNIQQGPFQSIQIHSYQSNDQHDTNNENEYDVGGNNHFDIYVFRNARMFGPKEKALRIYKLKDLIKEKKINSKRLITDYTKRFVVEEFLKFIIGDIKRKDLKSDIGDQLFPVNLMSAIYQSHLRYVERSNPWVTFPLSHDTKRN